MMDGGDILLGALCILGVILIIGMARDNRARRKHFLERIQASWGQIPDREYTWENLNGISQYFRKNGKEGFYIDDITWNDLDMDRIFMLLNQNTSAVGGDVLYDILRRPVFDEKILKERERLINFFHDNEEKRHQVQQVLFEIRKPGRATFFEAVHVTKDVNIGSGGMQLFLCLAFFLSLLSFILYPSVGVFIFIGMCVLNIGTYLSAKSDLEAFLTSFRCVIQLLIGAEALEKTKIAELESYIETCRSLRKSLAGFKRGSFLVVSRSAAGGGLEEMLLDYFRMMTHIDLIKFHEMMKCMKENMEEIKGLIELFGYLDSMISIASFREAMPYYAVPEFANYQKGEEAFMQVENLYHPLISEPVANSIDAKGGILVTGSNASGKSTFLKNVAVNAILAQTAYTCTAGSYRAPFFKVMTSMALRDDLESGESYYIVEIKSLKRILAEAEKEEPLLCIIDEVLRGTNTIERIAASSHILGRLQKTHVLPFAATHDIELSYMLEDCYTNYHFEEEVKEHDVEFNYLLKPGRVTTRNAIRLLSMIGYEQNLVKEAEDAVADFEKTGVWKKIERIGQE